MHPGCMIGLFRWILQTTKTLVAALQLTRVKVPLMVLGRRHQHQQDCEHSDGKQPWG